MQHAIIDKGHRGMGMEGAVARWYASLTRKAAEDFKALARRVAGEIPQGCDLLEVAPGPGYLAIELAKLGGYRIVGLDISHTFVEMARRNAEEAGVQVDFWHGNASEMPFRDESFDFLLCRAAFKNFSQPVRALQEMHRVMRAGGRALIIDLRKDVTPATVSQAIDEMGLGMVNTILTKLTFRYMLLKRAYTRGQFEQMAAETEFGSVIIKEDGLELEVTLGREAPV